MCKIIIEEPDDTARAELETHLAGLFPEHEIVATDKYHSPDYRKLESAVDNLINTVGSAVEYRINELSLRT
ncbi:MAG: hypothetical protein H8D23_04745 [Candidatus Brocadiales bacterium]|nr:hypothetical protein [Candidatus Brocadiales bacterium]